MFIIYLGSALLHLGVFLFPLPLLLTIIDNIKNVNIACRNEMVETFKQWHI
jgi:hypothetical protein